MEGDFLKYITKERLRRYMEFAGGNLAIAIELYNWNIRLSRSFYSILCYFEIVLRNICNEKLRKELGDLWFYNRELLLGNSWKKGENTLRKVEEITAKILGDRKGMNSAITNDDITSNIGFGFWMNLFCSNYEHKLWNPYLKHLFNGTGRKDIFELIDSVRRIRNRIFHYEPFIFKYDIEEEYRRILNFIGFMSNDCVKTVAGDLSDLKELMAGYAEYKKTRAVLHTTQ